ncbi:hypothetical protein QUB28_22460 [Microcoleus sp. B4-C3]
MPVPQTQRVSVLVGSRGWAPEPARPKLIENTARCETIAHLPLIGVNLR